MTLSHTTLNFLFSDTGRAALDWLAAQDLSDTNTLPLLNTLRREYAPDDAGAALTMARLRQRAAAKFSRADQMFFTPDALEQASSEVISYTRISHFFQSSYLHIVDLGCGIGGDAIMLGSYPGAGVIAVDRDALRLRMARANLAVYDRRWSHVVQADITDPLPLQRIRQRAGKEYKAAFFDPARRVESGGKKRRVFSVRDYVPPLDVIRQWDFEAMAVKLSPGVKLDELAPYIQDRARIEFVSLGGELKEAVLWYGLLGFGENSATRVEADGRVYALYRNPGAISVRLSAPRAYLYEPDPALIRAGLFAELKLELRQQIFLLDPQIAYLTADSYVPSPWLRAWPVLAWLPFNLKRLRAALRERNIGRVTVKKRGSPILPEDLIRKLKLNGEGDAAVIVLTQIADQHSAIICGEMLG
ncbi:MAG: class I SAM-dependent methyltransferase [Anaerolineae bacterium]|nr:class I SAM-dependent methyltransferase [Anaerolineae bacterium]